MLVSPNTIVTLEKWPLFLQELPALSSPNEPSFIHRPGDPHRLLANLVYSLGNLGINFPQGQCFQAPQNSSHWGRFGKLQSLVRGTIEYPILYHERDLIRLLKCVFTYPRVCLSSFFLPPQLVLGCLPIQSRKQ